MPSVIVNEGKDYWRTWFIEECERNRVFGLTRQHLPLIIVQGCEYSVGREIFLEDAPYFKQTQTHHRVCGPYIVVASKPRRPHKVILEKSGEIIVYKVKKPEDGPWHDGSVQRPVGNGVILRYQQNASRYAHFPYRFKIRKAEDYKVQYIRHLGRECWLCQ
jgi:hypothetical protein